MESSKEEHLQCHICLEFYTRPRALPCLHSFCESCLQEYIDKNAGPRRKEFACPVCRKTTAPPYPQRTLSEWAASFPLNFTLASIVDSSKKEQESPLCDPCRFEQKKVAADKYCVDCKEYLCLECTAFHKKTQILRSHKVVQLEEKEDALFSKSLETGNEICSCQRQKEIEIFCADHDELCCTVCATVKHRKCNEVQAISDADEMLLQSGQVDSFLEDMKILFDCCKSVTASLENDEKGLEKDRKRVISCIRNARRKIDSHVDELERRLIDETQTKFKVEGINIKRHLKNLKEVASDIQAQTQSIQNVTKSKEASVLSTFKKAEKKVKEIAEQMKKNAKHFQMTRLEFELDPNLSCLENTVDTFGMLRLHNQPVASVETLLTRGINRESNEREFAVTILNTFSAKTQGDGLFANITGICCVSTAKLVFTDYTNEKVKLFDVNGMFLDQFNIECPWDVTSIDCDSVAVTVCRGIHRGIHMFSIKDTGLEPQKHISMDRRALGITLSSNELTVACMDPPSVQVFSLDGILERTITNPQFEMPHYVVPSINENLLIFTDFGKNRVFGLLRDGEEKFVYDGILSPLGVTTDKQGNVFVCGDDANEVHAISSTTGKKLKVVLSADDVHRPQTILYNENTDSFFLTFDEDSNYTYQVWEIKIK